MKSGKCYRTKSRLNVIENGLELKLKELKPGYKPNLQILDCIHEIKRPHLSNFKNVHCVGDLFSGSWVIYSFDLL